MRMIGRSSLEEADITKGELEADVPSLLRGEAGTTATGGSNVAVTGSSGMPADTEVQSCAH